MEIEIEKNIEDSDAVVKVAGELHATVSDAVQAISDSKVDHEVVGSWLTTIFKAIFASLKP